ncbi:hypothetical protein [Pedobacter alluvionis]|nr:hypothetical protein [Pedobacter alluvionis]
MEKSIRPISLHQAFGSLTNLYSTISLTESNRIVVISTVAQRNGEIYLDLFRFIKHSETQLICTPITLTATIKTRRYRDKLQSKIFRREIHLIALPTSLHAIRNDDIMQYLMPLYIIPYILNSPHHNHMSEAKNMKYKPK